MAYAFHLILSYIIFTPVRSHSLPVIGMEVGIHPKSTEKAEGRFLLSILFSYRPATFLKKSQARGYFGLPSLVCSSEPTIGGALSYYTGLPRAVVAEGCFSAVPVPPGCLGKDKVPASPALIGHEQVTYVKFDQVGAAICFIVIVVPLRHSSSFLCLSFSRTSERAIG